MAEAFGFVAISMNDFGDGIDQLSAETKIPTGYVENATNVDFTPTGMIKSRTGTMTHSGFIPIPIEKITYIGGATVDNIRLKVVGNLNLFNLNPQPIIVRGTTSKAGNPSNIGLWPTNSVATIPFSTYRNGAIAEVGSGSSTTVLVGASTNMHWAGSVRSTSFSSKDNFTIVPDTETFDAATGYVTVEMTAETGTLQNLFLYEIAPEAGANYIGSFTCATGTSITTINAATHGMVGTNYIVRCYRNISGTNWERFIPDTVTVEDNATINVSVTNNIGTSFPMKISIVKVPITNVKSSIMTLNNFTTYVQNIPSPYSFFSCWYREGGVWKEFLADKIEYVQSTNSVIVTATNYDITRQIKICYLPAEVRTDEIVLTGPQVITGFVDELPQLYVYGIQWASCLDTYNPDAAAITLLDAYRDAAAESLVTSIQGRFFQQTADLTSYNVNVRATTIFSQDVLTIGPTFQNYETDLTNSFVTSASEDNWLHITSAIYDEEAEETTVTLKATNLQIIGTPWAESLRDYLTIKDCDKNLNGRWPIKSWSSDADSITVILYTPLGDEVLIDLEGQGIAACFSSFITVTSGINQFIVGDRVLGATVPANVQLEIMAAYDGMLVVDGATDFVSITNADQLWAARITDLIPLEASDTGKFVAGDHVQFAEPFESPYFLLRSTMVQRSYPLLTLTVTEVVGTGSIATAKIAGTVPIKYLFGGDRILVLGMGPHSGEHTIAGLTTDGVDTWIDWESSEPSTITSTGSIRTPMLQLVEEVPFESGATVQLLSRWNPITSVIATTLPTPNRVPNTFPETFPTVEPMRSVMQSGNLYVTSPNNGTKVFDGFFLRRAGLPNWNPLLSVQVENVAGISVVPNEVTATARSGKTFTVTAGDEAKFAIGTRVRIMNGSTWVATGFVSDNTLSGKITIDPIRGNMTSVTVPCTLQEAYLYKYAARLRAVDSMGNVLVGPTTGLNDAQIEIGGTSTVRLTLMEPPHLEEFPYDNGTFIEVLRTVANSDATWYRVALLQCNFKSNDPYLTFRDPTSDDVLVYAPSDTISNAIRGGFGLGVGPTPNLHGPLSAGAMTSLGNRLVLGNLKGEPHILFAVRKIAALTPTDFVNGTFAFSCTGQTPVTFEFSSTVFSISASSRAVDIVTLTLSGGTFVTGDWLWVSSTPNSGSVTSGPCGWFQVVTGGSGSCTIRSSGTLGTLTTGFICVASNKTRVPVFTGTDAAFGDTEGNTGSADAAEKVLIRRLALAIQAHQTATGQVWLRARAGADMGSGVLLVQSPEIDTKVTITLASVGFVVNDLLYTSGSQIGFVRNLYPSRIIYSAPNYPEAFLNPEGDPNVVTAAGTTESTAPCVIDVNASDGDEIVALLPFFGEAAFGAAQQSGVLLVLKHRSLYVVDLNATGEPVQKLETQGQGCDSPLGCCFSREGILFSNRNGIWKLTRALQIEWVGAKIDRLLSEDTTHYSRICAGTSRGKDKIERFSYGTTTYVYNSQRESVGGQGNGLGSWTTYKLPETLAWCNAAGITYFGTNDGRVCRIRYSSEPLLDDGVEVAQEVVFAMTDFGDNTARKSLGRITFNFRNVDKNEDMNWQHAVDGSQDWQTVSKGNIAGNKGDDQLVSESAKKTMYFSSRFDNDRCTLSQFRLQTTKRFELISIGLRAKLDDPKGNREAKNT